MEAARSSEAPFAIQRPTDTIDARDTRPDDMEAEQSSLRVAPGPTGRPDLLHDLKHAVAHQMRQSRPAGSRVMHIVRQLKAVAVGVARAAALVQNKVVEIERGDVGASPIGRADDLRGHAVERDHIGVIPRRVEAGRRVGAVRPIDGDGRDLGRAGGRCKHQSWPDVNIKLLPLSRLDRPV